MKIEKCLFKLLCIIICLTIYYIKYSYVIYFNLYVYTCKKYVWFYINDYMNNQFIMVYGTYKM